MKRIVNLGTLLLILFTFSCKDGSKNKVTPNQFSQKVLNVASQKIIDDLKAQGMPVYGGTTEPLVQGIFQMQSLVFVKDWAASSISRVGAKADATKMQFVAVDFIDPSDHETVDIYFKLATSSNATFWKGTVSGNGNLFTAFTEVLAQYSDGTSLVLIIAISGEITPDGIKDYHFAQYVKEISNDPKKVFSVGSIVILKEEDSLAEKTSVF
ncbi:hypothetical protein [Salmonirosea aquatica]|uniref:Lipoprotein n=1 Tax=Salmonirosea aquatica TaxID=2654236 RepID=A0A7C9FNR0_9BACT|nr:hypothetical protein [Cytophagaceae bacterium SJW1-29]